jgi:hypothetical protein
MPLGWHGLLGMHLRIRGAVRLLRCGPFAGAPLDTDDDTPFARRRRCSGPLRVSTEWRDGADCRRIVRYVTWADPYCYAHVDMDMLIVGYMRAVGRFMTGGDRPGPLVERAVRHQLNPTRESDPFDDDVPMSAYYHALFEALNWAYTLDDRLRRDAGSGWWKGVPDGGMIPGIRWARNCVQHQWDEAVYLDEDPANLPPRQINHSWRWRGDLAGRERDHHGRAAYAEHLADSDVLITLTTLMPLFARAAVALADRNSAG